MNFFIFLTISAVSVLSSNIMIDPREFLLMVQDADPTTVQQLINYAGQLKDEGEVVRKKVIAADVAAKAAAVHAAQVLKQATENHRQKTQTEETRAKELVQKTKELSAANAALKDAVSARKDAQSKFDTAQATMNKNLARIKDEDGDLKEVRALLKTLIPEVIEISLGRKLLEDTDVTIDPAGVTAVIQLIDNLLDAGQNEAAQFVELRDKAKAVLDAAKKDHDKKHQAQVHALGAESVAKSRLAVAQKELAAALDKVNGATQEKGRLDKASADALAHRIKEVNRINAELTSFNEIIVLLKKLVKKST